jgi:adenosylcobinamide amidohydrolase
MRLELHWRSEDGLRLPMALWRPGPGYRMISSAIVGGGLGPREWVLNAQVAGGYDRTDPVVHLADLAAGLGLSGPGIGLLTAAQVTAVVQRQDEGAHVAATVGLRVPTWAAAPAGSADAGLADPGLADPGLADAGLADAGLADAGLADAGLAPTRRPGTINIVVSVPVPLSDAAFVNAVITATEAKTQAVLDAGFACTGTASDAVCVAAPGGGPGEDFAGPRSVWGARIARAVHAAVYAGALGYARRAGYARPAAAGGPVSGGSSGLG